MFDLKDIRKLVKLLENSEISEIEISDNERKIRLVKSAPNDGRIMSERVVSVPAQAALPPTVPAEAEAAELAKSVPAGGRNVKVMKSPMVGTFYQAPSPDAEPYVQVGDYVHKGQVLCIVEAMKLMNEIESEFDGRIIEVLVENAQPVEYDHELFAIEAA